VSSGFPKSRSASVVTSLVVLPSAREGFAPRELLAAYKDFLGGEPRYIDAETGMEVKAYRFGTRTLLIYEEPEEGAIVLIRPLISPTP
jgi:hypothetical protein